MGKDTPKIKSQSVLSTYISMKSIVSNIERIADNATNIAEAAIYSIEGKDVRHKRIEKIKKDTNV
jgi:phosphate transport system protein